METKKKNQDNTQQHARIPARARQISRSADAEGRDTPSADPLSKEVTGADGDADDERVKGGEGGTVDVPGDGALRACSLGQISFRSVSKLRDNATRFAPNVKCAVQFRVGAASPWGYCGTLPSVAKVINQGNFVRFTRQKLIRGKFAANLEFFDFLSLVDFPVGGLEERCFSFLLDVRDEPKAVQLLGRMAQPQRHNLQERRVCDDHPTTDQYFMTQLQPVPFMRQPLNYHNDSSAILAAFSVSTTDRQFIPPLAELCMLLQGQSRDLRMAPPQGLNLLEEIQGYHSLIPLENLANTGEHKWHEFRNWHLSVHRAINAVDGGTYCLRQIENCCLMHHTVALGGGVAFTTSQPTGLGLILASIVYSVGLNSPFKQ
ncbi:hypothetical protein B0H14DRAFT_3714180 [Mycena olivaceomarginata]|nr:hypothetical protein B0H14DRAFT_3714180 [Mycena olivaceomarginata]